MSRPLHIFYWLFAFEIKKIMEFISIKYFWNLCQPNIKVSRHQQKSLYFFLNKKNTRKKFINSSSWMVNNPVTLYTIVQSCWQ